MDEAGRQHRTTNDVLGRLAKVEELNWDNTVYSTANYAYDALDHLTGINHEGQVRSFAYDGHGRLQTRTTPEQGTTTYAYNADDTTYSITDARGASSTLNYNNRHLLTGINYRAPYGVAPTPNVSFGYDAAGNRTLMTDGLGSVSYGYNQLSQLTSETRTLPVASFALTYGYNLAGELTSLANPWGAQVGYGYDNTGRLTNVSGSGYAGVSNYASGVSYRAWDAVKSMSYGNNLTSSTSYDGRLRPTTWNVSNVLGYNYNYDYYNERTGRVTYAQSIYDSTLDRSYQYDQVGALVISHSGAEARASAYSGQWGIMDGPYSQGYDYDKFGNMTRRYGWGGEVQGGSAGQSSDIFYNYTNNRRNGFSYDPAGNLTNDLAQSYSYDATGQQTTASSSGYFLQQGYDGNGLRAQKTEYGATTYYLRSTVLGGQVVAEVDGGGGWQRGYVYAGSRLLAVQQGGVNWVHEDSVTKSKRITDVYGNIVSTVELDPWGATTNRSSGGAFQPRHFTTYQRDGNGSDEAMFRRFNRSNARFDQPDPYGGSYDFSDPQSLNRYAYVKNDPVNFSDPTGLEAPTCMLDGMPISCGTAGMFVNAGAGVRGPLNTTRWNANSDGMGHAGFDTFRAVGPYAGWFDMHGVFITINAYINGELVGSASSYQGFGTRDFGGNPLMGSFDQWPPQWPGIDRTFGWGTKPTGPPRVTLPGGEPIKMTPPRGTPGVRVDPNDLIKQPVNPTRPTLPPNPSFWDKIRVIFGNIGGGFANGSQDFIGPVVVP